MAEELQRIDNRTDLWVNNKCDKFDYLTAAFCGGMAGLIDVIFVQSPDSSKLVELGDKASDRFVERAAKFFYKHDKRTTNKPRKPPEGLAQCIDYLEQAFPVPYDARYAKDLKDSDGLLKGMTSKNHHLKSLAHSPDPIGLIFSIIDQFAGTASFVDNGKVIHLEPVKQSGATPIYELRGKSFPAKLFCGFVNWIGHIISDLSGSSSTRRKEEKRGAGVPIPFYEMLLMSKVEDQDKRPFAEAMIDVYEKGYDARFGMVMTIPVLFEELAVRCIWSIRQKFVRNRPWKECIPSSKHSDLRIMMLIGNGVLCTVDGIDAAARGIASHNLVAGLAHVNIIAWSRFAVLGLKEVTIRLKIVINNPDDPFLESILGKIPQDEKERIRAFAEQTKKLVGLLDVQKQLELSLNEYKEARAERIRIQAEYEKNHAEILAYRNQISVFTENYLSEKMEVFQKGLATMDQALLEGDPDVFISGSGVIQQSLGYDSQFSSQSEFDDLMQSDDAFKL